MKIPDWLVKVSRVISYTFNGVACVVAPAVIAFAVSNVDLKYKILFPSLYILSTVVPYFILRKMGKVTDMEFSKREERPLYFTIASTLYLVLFLASAFLKDSTIFHITLTTFVTTCVLTIVNLYWKMSGHMTFSTLFFFSLLYIFPSVKLLPLVFILTPIIAATRVILKKHTVWQTVVGTLASAAVCILFYWFL